MGLALFWSVLLGLALVRADDPQGKDTPKPLAATGRQNICLTAGDDGPFFYYSDLESYVPPPTSPPVKWEIKPPIRQTYPDVIKDTPYVPRQYATETIAYLAEHEILHGDRKRPYMALTFDCESGGASTRRILDVLREEETKATFFVLGKYAYLYPDLVWQIVADGHEVGNHSFFHPLFTTVTPTLASQEITYTELVIDWAAGQHVPMRYVRFPYGGRGYPERLHAAAFGYQSAFWDIDPRGWDPNKTVTDVITHVQHTAHRGGIVIMHCGSWDDANALPDVIRVIRDLGMQPGTLTDVLTPADYDVPNYPKTPRQDDHVQE